MKGMKHFRLRGSARRGPQAPNGSRAQHSHIGKEAVRCDEAKPLKSFARRGASPYDLSPCKTRRELGRTGIKSCIVRFPPQRGSKERTLAHQAWHNAAVLHEVARDKRLGREFMVLPIALSKAAIFAREFLRRFNSGMQQAGINGMAEREVDKVGGVKG